MANSKLQQVIEIFVGPLMLFVRRNNGQCQPRPGSGAGCLWRQVLFRSLADWQEDTPLLDRRHVTEFRSILTLSCMIINSGCHSEPRGVQQSRSTAACTVAWEYASASGAKISPASLLLPDVAARMLNSCYLSTYQSRRSNQARPHSVVKQNVGQCARRLWPKQTPRLKHHWRVGTPVHV